SDVGGVAFDDTGKYLYLLVSTEAGPVKQWFAQSGTDLRAQYGLYHAVLDRQIPSPFAKERDEEKAEAEQKGDAETKDGTEKRKAETLREGVTGYRLTPDGKKVLTVTLPDTWAIAEAAPGVPPGKGKLNTDAIEVRIDPRAEWAQIYDEAWRINRDYFYDPHY